MEDGKKSKGKQKIEIKKIVDKKSRCVTFTKRKSGIHKKACDMMTLCGAKVDVLMFSPSGKSYCFGEPLLQSVNEENPSISSLDKLVKEHRSLEMQEINRKYDELLDELHVEQEKEEELRRVLKTMNGRGWWEVKVEHLSNDQAKKMMVYYGEIEKKLINELSIKGGDIASHYGQTSGFANKDYGIGTSKNHSPNPFFIDQPSGANSNLTYGHGSNNFGANDNAYGFGASGNNQLDLAPMDQATEDLFNRVFPLNQVCGYNLSDLDNAFSFNESDKIPGGNESHAPNFSPSYRYEGGNPFISGGSKENVGTSGSETLVTSSLANRYQDVYSFLFDDEDDDFTFPPING